MKFTWFDMAYLRSCWADSAPRPPHRGSPQTMKWRWDRTIVEAATKSEARALMKKQLGLRRLPAGANVVRVKETSSD